MDRQSAAFREATPADRVLDDQLLDHAEAVHHPLDDPAVLRSVDDYEADEWDAERIGPKSAEDARRELAARIADPSAPDGDDVAGAYDGLE